MVNFLALLVCGLYSSCGEQIPEEAVTSWSELRAAYAKLAGEFNISVYATENGKKEKRSERHRVFAMNGKLARVKFGSKKLSLVVLNDKYGFRLTREPLVERYLLNGVEPDVPKGWKEMRSLLIDWVSAPWSILASELPELLANPEFKAIRHYEKAEGGIRRAYLEFEYTMRAESTVAIRKGVVEFLPNRHWVVERLACDDFKRKQRIVFDHEYQESRGLAFPMIKRIVRKYIVTDTGFEETHVCTFSNLKPTEVSKSEFYMAEFGFTEPFTESRNVSWTNLMITVGAAIIVLCVWFVATKQARSTVAK